MYVFLLSWGMLAQRNTEVPGVYHHASASTIIVYIFHWVILICFFELAVVSDTHISWFHMIKVSWLLLKPLRERCGDSPLNDNLTVMKSSPFGWYLRQIYWLVSCGPRLFRVRPRANASPASLRKNTTNARSDSWQPRVQSHGDLRSSSSPTCGGSCAIGGSLTRSALVGSSLLQNIDPSVPLASSRISDFLHDLSRF